MRNAAEGWWCNKAIITCSISQWTTYWWHEICLTISPWTLWLRCYKAALNCYTDSYLDITCTFSHQSMLLKRRARWITCCCCILILSCQSICSQITTCLTIRKKKKANMAAAYVKGQFKSIQYVHHLVPFSEHQYWTIIGQGCYQAKTS